MIIQIGTVNFWPAAAMSQTTFTFEDHKSMIDSALLSLSDDGYDFSSTENSNSAILYQIRYENQSAGSIIFAQTKTIYRLESKGVPHQVVRVIEIKLGQAIERYLDKNNPNLLEWLEKEIKPKVGDEIRTASKETESGKTLSFDSFSVGGRAVKGDAPRQAGGNGAGRKKATDEEIKVMLKLLDLTENLRPKYRTYPIALGYAYDELTEEERFILPDIPSAWSTVKSWRKHRKGVE